MRYNIIAIEREFASGGREIGEKLSGMLRIPCYGQLILEKAAEKLGLSANELEKLEESMTGSFLHSIHMLANITSGQGGDAMAAQKLAVAESEVIKDLAYNPCVIIGRSAAGLFKDKDNVLKVFIYADHKTRISRAAEAYNVDSKKAESVLQRFDKRRANYFKVTSGAGWRDENIYNMFLNSGKLGIDSVVDILYTAAR